MCAPLKSLIIVLAFCISSASLSGTPVQVTTQKHQLDHALASIVRETQVSMFPLAPIGELEQHPLVGEVRGKGLLAAIELVANKASRQAGAFSPVAIDFLSAFI